MQDVNKLTWELNQILDGKEIFTGNENYLFFQNNKPEITNDIMPCAAICSRGWSKLNHLQLGKCGELYAAIKLTEKGFDVYQSFIDDHGVDLIAIKDKKVYYVQVKTVRIGTYSFIRKNKLEDMENTIICYIQVVDDNPHFYCFPATVWKSAIPEQPFSNRDYDGLKSQPEYGISGAKKHISKLNEISDVFWDKI